MPKRKLPLRPSTNKPEELQSMRKGGKNQMWGKGCYNKGVIIATLKQPLWISRGQEKHTIVFEEVAHVHMQAREDETSLRADEYAVRWTRISCVGLGWVGEGLESTEGSRTEHARLSQFLNVSLIKSSDKGAPLLLLLLHLDGCAPYSKTYMLPCLRTAWHTRKNNKEHVASQPYLTYSITSFFSAFSSQSCLLT